MGQLLYSSHPPAEAHATTPVSYSDDFVGKISRVPTHASYQNGCIHDRSEKEKGRIETVTATDKVTKKRRKKRDVLKSWFHRGHKAQKEGEIENDTVLIHKHLDTIPHLETPHKTEKQEQEQEQGKGQNEERDDEHDGGHRLEDEEQKEQSTIVDPFDDPPKYLSFRALFKRRRNQSFVSEFEDIGSLKRSKTLRERLFGTTSTRLTSSYHDPKDTLTKQSDKQAQEDHKTMVYDVSETLTQRYMSNNYDKVVEDMDAIPFDLTVDQTHTGQHHSLRSKVSQIFQVLSPVKTSNVLEDDEGGGQEQEYDDDDGDDDENPYNRAKKNSLRKLTVTHGLPHTPYPRDDDTLDQQTSTGRFETLKRGITKMFFGSTRGQVDDEIDDDNDTDSFISRSTSFENSAELFNAKQVSSSSSSDHQTISRFSSAETMTMEEMMKFRSITTHDKEECQFDKFVESDKFEKWFNGENDTDLSGSTKCVAKTSTTICTTTTEFMTPQNSAFPAYPVHIELKPHEDCSSVAGIQATIILNKKPPPRQEEGEKVDEEQDPDFYENVRQAIIVNKQRQIADLRGHPRRHQYLAHSGTVRL